MLTILRRFLIASALGVAAVGSASAADPPANTEQCHKVAAEVADAAGKGTPAADAKAKLDELFARLKSDCDAGAFADAVRTADAIRSTAGIKN